MPSGEQSTDKLLSVDDGPRVGLDGKQRRMPVRRGVEDEYDHGIAVEQIGRWAELTAGARKHPEGLGSFINALSEKLTKPRKLEEAIS